VKIEKFPSSSAPEDNLFTYYLQLTLQFTTHQHAFLTKVALYLSVSIICEFLLEKLFLTNLLPKYVTLIMFLVVLGDTLLYYGSTCLQVATRVKTGSIISIVFLFYSF